MLYDLTFPRTDNPLVTVFLVTRGRPDLLLGSVRSLTNQAVEPTKIEFLFRVDSDDYPSVIACTQLTEQLPNARLLIDRRGLGYLGMHHTINMMSKLARGDWILLWNDDALMQTSGWDDILSKVTVPCWHNNPDVYVLFPQTLNRPECTDFQFLRRRVVEILGHIGLSPHADNWITRVMSGVQSCAWIGSIAIDHLSDRMDDQTRRESVAAYDNGNLARATLESPEALRLIAEDVSKIRAYLNQGAA